jgi:ribosomal protein S27E
MTGVTPGVYTLRTIFENTSEILFTKNIIVKTAGIVVTPEQGLIYAPGQSINITVTANYLNLINVTIGKMNGTNDGNITLTYNQSLTDFAWSTVWDIPANFTTGEYPIWVNWSHDNTPIAGLPVNPLWIDIEYFDVSVAMDKAAYLPGETMIVSYLARSVPNNDIIPIALDWEMQYQDAISGLMAWQNATFAASPFNVTLPSHANINWNILVNVTAHAANNHTANWNVGIELGGLQTDISTDKATYAPGEKIIISVEAWVNAGPNPPVADATVNVLMYDNKGALVPGLNLTALMTGPTGWTKGIITLPLTIEVADNYQLVADTSKFSTFADLDSVTIDIADNWDVKVLVDKTVYVSGENINVVTQVWKNGAITTPDNIEYWLSVSGYNYPHVNLTTGITSFVVVAPALNQNGDGVIHMIATVAGKMRPVEDSNGFTISPLVISLGASEVSFYGGDTVTFTAKVAGSIGGFTFSYQIWNDVTSPVQNGTLTLDTSGIAKFTLAIPETNPSPSYTARVIADNGLGVVASPALTINWFSPYLLNIDVLTGPSSTTGSYAPGQTLTISFEITKMSIELADLTVVRAEVNVYMGTPSSGFFWGYGQWVAAGEVNSFTGMKGELSVVLPDELPNGAYTIVVTVTGMPAATSVVMVNANEAGWQSSVGGMSASDLLMTILMIVVIVMLLFMMMKKGGAAAAPAEPKPAAPKEAKQDTYQPKSSVKCPSCGNMVEVATSKRPIEVMCPKCGTSQMVN